VQTERSRLFDDRYIYIYLGCYGGKQTWEATQLGTAPSLAYSYIIIVRTLSNAKHARSNEELHSVLSNFEKE